MSKAIFELVDQLPTSNMTTRALKSLDFVVPGEWNNLVGFENTIRDVTGEDDEDVIQGNWAIVLSICSMIVPRDTNEPYGFTKLSIALVVLLELLP